MNTTSFLPARRCPGNIAANRYGVSAEPRPCWPTCGHPCHRRSPNARALDTAAYCHGRPRQLVRAALSPAGEPVHQGLAGPQPSRPRSIPHQSHGVQQARAASMKAGGGNDEPSVITHARHDLRGGPQAPQSAAKGRQGKERQQHARMGGTHDEVRERPLRHHSQRSERRAQRKQQQQQQQQQLGRGAPAWDGDTASLCAVPPERLGGLLLACAAAGVPLRRSSLQAYADAVADAAPLLPASALLAALDGLAAYGFRTAQPQPPPEQPPQRPQPDAAARPRSASFSAPAAHGDAGDVTSGHRLHAHAQPGAAIWTEAVLAALLLPLPPAPHQQHRPPPTVRPPHSPASAPSDSTPSTPRTQLPTASPPSYTSIEQQEQQPGREPNTSYPSTKTPPASSLPRVCSLPPADLCRLPAALHRLGVAPRRPWLRAVLVATAPSLPAMTGQQLLQLLSGLAALRAKPHRAWWEAVRLLWGPEGTGEASPSTSPAAWSFNGAGIRAAEGKAEAEAGAAAGVGPGRVGSRPEGGAGVDVEVVCGLLYYIARMGMRVAAPRPVGGFEAPGAGAGEATGVGTTRLKGGAGNSLGQHGQQQQLVAWVDWALAATARAAAASREARSSAGGGVGAGGAPIHSEGVSKSGTGLTASRGRAGAGGSAGAGRGRAGSGGTAGQQVQGEAVLGQGRRRGGAAVPSASPHQQPGLPQPPQPPPCTLSPHAEALGRAAAGLLVAGRGCGFWEAAVPGSARHAALTAVTQELVPLLHLLPPQLLLDVLQGLTGSGLHPGRAFLRRHEAAAKRHVAAGEGGLDQLQLLQLAQHYRQLGHVPSSGSLRDAIQAARLWVRKRRDGGPRVSA